MILMDQRLATCSGFTSIRPQSESDVEASGDCSFRHEPHLHELDGAAS